MAADQQGVSKWWSIQGSVILFEQEHDVELCCGRELGAPTSSPKLGPRYTRDPPHAGESACGLQYMHAWMSRSHTYFCSGSYHGWNSLRHLSCACAFAQELTHGRMGQFHKTASETTTLSAARHYDVTLTD